MIPHSRALVIAFPRWASQSVPAFHRVMDALITVIPKCAMMRPGLACVPARGPARFYGSEQAAAEAVRVTLEAFQPIRVGAADTLGTALIAVRRTTSQQPIQVIPPGNTAAQISPLAIEFLGNEVLAAELRQLGITTIGDFATLDPELVANRFGLDGAVLHAQARATDAESLHQFTPYEPDLDVTQRVTFDPPLDSAEQVAFGCMRAAEQFVALLSVRHEVCTEVAITCRAEMSAVTTADPASAGTEDYRIWRHAQWFRPRDIVDRIRWQLAHQSAIDSPIEEVVIEAHLTDALESHQPGLWGGSADGALQHTLARLQSQFSHTAVLTPRIVGGRLLHERQQFTPAGEAQPKRPDVSLPWPGHLDIPLPSVVYPTPIPTQVYDAQAKPVLITARGLLQSAPKTFIASAQEPAPIAAYWGPWTLHERWWEGRVPRYRLQVVTRLSLAELASAEPSPTGVSRAEPSPATEQAFLLVFSHERWFVEGKYD